jgi:hypothetical protein
MDLNAAIDIIIKDLNEAREIIDDLKRYPGVPEFQVELAKSKCKSASEIIALIKNQPVKPSSEKEKTIVKEETQKEKFVEKVSVVVPAPETASKEIFSQMTPEASPVTEVKPAPAAMKHTDSAIIADQFSNRPESYNEKLSSRKHDDDVLEIIKLKPLLRIDEAIGINDKFLFIREIFNGNQDLYNQAINKLESVGNLSDAMAVVMSYTGDNTSNEAVKQLIDLIKRKFPSNE